MQLFSLLFALLWTGFIVRIVVPWGRFMDHSHWARVVWIPFLSPPYRAFDIVANTLLYVPLGSSLTVGLGRGGRRGWAVVGLAGLLSVGTEWTQLYSHGRWPSLTDVSCNVLGAWVGWLLLTAWQHKSSR